MKWLSQWVDWLRGDLNASTMIDSITTPNGFSVALTDHGEHEPGAREIRFELSDPLEGVAVFRTTNGSGFYDAVLDRVFLYDSCLILEIDPQTRRCRHKNYHSPWGFQMFVREGDLFRFVYLCEDAEEKQEQLPFEEIYWHTGMGFASQGRFPSAPIQFKPAARLSK